MSHSIQSDKHAPSRDDSPISDDRVLLSCDPWSLLTGVGEIDRVHFLGIKESANAVSVVRWAARHDRSLPSAPFVVERGGRPLQRQILRRP